MRIIHQKPERKTEVYPFHGKYPNLPDLFHASCADHADFGACGTRADAHRALADHLDTHDKEQDHG